MQDREGEGERNRKRETLWILWILSCLFPSSGLSGECPSIVKMLISVLMGWGKLKKHRVHWVYIHSDLGGNAQVPPLRWGVSHWMLLWIMGHFSSL